MPLVSKRGAFSSSAGPQLPRSLTRELGGEPPAKLTCHAPRLWQNGHSPLEAEQALQRQLEKKLGLKKGRKLSNVGDGLDELVPQERAPPGAPKISALDELRLQAAERAAKREALAKKEEAILRSAPDDEGAVASDDGVASGSEAGSMASGSEDSAMASDSEDSAMASDSEDSAMASDSEDNAMASDSEDSAMAMLLGSDEDSESDGEEKESDGEENEPHSGVESRKNRLETSASALDSTQ
ncbi:hypothetical protein H632_c1851p0, partial [Helicosporidium sp. ATCC 50920]